jgi:hypothetical protein
MAQPIGQARYQRRMTTENEKKQIRRRSAKLFDEAASAVRLFLLGRGYGNQQRTRESRQ